MNKKDLQRFRKLIEDERRRVVQRIGMIEEEIQGMAASQSGNQSYSNHMADIGSARWAGTGLFARQPGTTTSWPWKMRCGASLGDVGCAKVRRRFPAAVGPSSRRLCIKCQSKLERLQRVSVAFLPS
jgi:hypothetical protein